MPESNSGVNLNTQALISSQNAGGASSASSQPFTFNSMIGESFELGGELMSFLNENLDQILSFLEGAFAGDLASAIDNGSMAKGLVGSPPQNCMITNSPGMSGNLSPPEGPGGNIMGARQNLVSASKGS